MPNNYFKFKQFTIEQENAPFKVGTDGVLIGAWANVQDCKQILDVGTGTGLIALMCAQRSQAKVVGIEPNAQASRNAKQNIDNSPFQNSVQIVETSIQKFGEGNKEKFDLIVSNPPFFENSLRNEESGKAQARHAISLHYSELIAIVAQLLTVKGRLSLILPFSQKEECFRKAAVEGFFLNRACTVFPIPGKDAIRIMLEFGREKCTTQYSELVLEVGGRHQYSNEYKALTRDFYLAF
jgi:tRNA1Val (adenine37-N6)-methyltransferase